MSRKRYPVYILIFYYDSTKLLRKKPVYVCRYKNVGSREKIILARTGAGEGGAPSDLCVTCRRARTGNSLFCHLLIFILFHLEIHFTLLTILGDNEFTKNYVVPKFNA